VQNIHSYALSGYICDIRVDIRHFSHASAKQEARKPPESEGKKSIKA
jgi:hypothetical protein